MENGITSNRITDIKEYRTWKGMKSRCYNPNTKDWADYGERGITVCAEWRHDFLRFFNDMGPKPTASHG